VGEPLPACDGTASSHSFTAPPGVGSSSPCHPALEKSCSNHDCGHHILQAIKALWQCQCLVKQTGSEFPRPAKIVEILQVEREIVMLV